ncbi:terminase gpA endonuclease subunit [Roseiconus lacunae]|uniref:Phage terminase large subunit family protein n=1 Tax=Roseiconus lacunae TaxID=2605694 RepID=A0ABT7PHM4_9BACT|nr:terminase gpA endonuclease subunit [Roseiconus lacunae]MDM4015833.1 phage terminase large subunit family protein [Roseiconus lacunae]
MTTVFELELAESIEAGKSYAPRTFREWIEQELIIPDGPFVGERFRIERQPAHGVWIDAVDDPQWTELVFTAVTQFGKSLMAHVAPILYHTCELGQSLTWALPTADMADTKWQQDFRPVMEANPTLRKLLPTRGSGSRGGKVRDMITLANGAILKIQSVGLDDSAKGGFTSPIMAATEAAGFSKAGESSVEADPLRQAKARQRAYKRSMRRSYVEGTLTTEEELPWALYEGSSKSRLVAPCPHCLEYVHPTEDDLIGWQDARSEMEAIDNSHWRCPKCKRRISEPDRHKALLKTKLVHDGQTLDRDGRVHGKKPPTTRLWFHATPFFNLLLEPADIGAEEWATMQIPEDTAERIAAEKERAQFRWAKTYKPPAIDGQIDLSREGIAGRRNDLPQNALPNDVGLLVYAFDTGDRKGWFASMGTRPNGELFVPTYGDFDIPSDKAQVEVAIQAALEGQIPMLSAGLPKQSGGTMRPHAVGCDCGHRQKATWAWTRHGDLNPRQALDQWAIAMRGRGESQMESRQRWNCPKDRGSMVRQIGDDRTWYIEWVKRANVFEMHWDADGYKLHVQHGLTLDLHAPGSISFFAGSNRTHSRIARHCINERLIYEFVPLKGKVARWHRFGDNHLLDCMAMCYALLVKLGYQPPSLPRVSEQAPPPGNIAEHKQHVDTQNTTPVTTPSQVSANQPGSASSDASSAEAARARISAWIKSIS